MNTFQNPIGSFEVNNFNLIRNFKVFIKKARDKKFFNKEMTNFLNIKNKNSNFQKLFTIPYKYKLRIISKHSKIKNSNLSLRVVFLNKDISTSTNSIIIDNIKRSDYVLEPQFYLNILSSKYRKNENGNIFQFCVYIDNKKIFTSCGFKIYSRKSKRVIPKQPQIVYVPVIQRYVYCPQNNKFYPILRNKFIPQKL